MRCTSPRTVGFQADGKTICWSQKSFSKEYATFQLPCGKCIECRLDYARQWAIRCVHEAQMHPENSFVTLTYSPENLKSDKLIYSDFQKFMKRLRKSINQPIGCFVTGEYGDRNQRPHWHCLIFNWRPQDARYKYSNERGDKIYTSEHLSKLWGLGLAEYGDVTFESAGYCARYAAKKLVHGADGTHEYEPISKKSSKHAIGKTWLEQYWPDVFSYGKLILKDGTQTSIPRYYEKWLKKNHPGPWSDYVTRTKTKNINAAAARAQKEIDNYLDNLHSRKVSDPTPLTPNEVKKKIQKQKFKRLQNYLKL